MARLMCKSRDTFQAKYLSETKKQTPLPDAEADRTEDGDNSTQDIRGQFKTNVNKGQYQELEIPPRDLEHRITELCREQAESKRAVEALLERLTPDALFGRSAEQDQILDAKLEAIWYALQAIVHSGGAAQDTERGVK
ncbi:uncharacterized protein PG998_007315 [Apiospora kogelbergensis]|uniref:Uncharacterized protein n=1 Tax=Apiospora kogelbergensis TaxID=1337665 RepID=A0AAW0QJ62_9PEZI